MVMRLQPHKIFTPDTISGSSITQEHLEGSYATRINQIFHFSPLREQVHPTTRNEPSLKPLNSTTKTQNTKHILCLQKPIMRILRKHIANGAINQTFKLGHCLITGKELLLTIERGLQLELLATGLEIERIRPSSCFNAKLSLTPLHVSEGFGTAFSQLGKTGLRSCLH